MKQETKQSLIKLGITALVFISLILGAYLIMRQLGWADLSQEQLQDKIQSYGAKAPLIYILVSFMQVTVLPIPGAVTVLAGNYLFGPIETFVYAYIGALIGSFISFSLGKIVGRPFVNWIAGSKETVDEWLSKMRGKEGVILFFMFFFPFFPDDILCAIAGLLPFTYRGFMSMQLVTRATSIFGTLFFMSGEIIPWRGWGLVVLALVAIVFIAAFVICFINAEKLDNYFSGLFRKVYYKEPYFMSSKKGYSSGKRVGVIGKFRTKNSLWRVAGLYLCKEGYVVDLYSISNKRIHIPEADFVLSAVKEEKVIENDGQVRHVCYQKTRAFRKKRDKKVDKFTTHYKLELRRSRVYIRAFLLDDSPNKMQNLKNFHLIVNTIDEHGNEVKRPVYVIPKKRKLKYVIKSWLKK